jgi:hypothetical protein
LLVSAVTTAKFSEQKKCWIFEDSYGFRKARWTGSCVRWAKIPSDTHDKDLIEELAGRKSRKVGSA